VRHAWSIGAIVTASALLSGCATLPTPPHEDALASVTRGCLAMSKQFTDAWGCIQSRDALDDTGVEDPRRKQFMKLGDGLASQVGVHKLRSDEAKKRLMAGLLAQEGT